jgi:hypothetical protein
MIYNTVSATLKHTVLENIKTISMNKTAQAGVALGMFSLGLKAAATCDSDNGGTTLPAGFCALPAADGLGSARHHLVVAAPNGEVYVALQGDGEMGGVAALRDSNGDVPGQVPAAESE